YGTVEAINSGTTDGRVITLGNGTHTLSGNFDIQTSTTGNLTVQNTNNIAVNITGDVTNSVHNDTVTLSMGSGTWTVSGNFDLTNVDTFNNNSGTLIMNGASKSLTTNAKTFFNLTFS